MGCSIHSMGVDVVRLFDVVGGVAERLAQATTLGALSLLLYRVLHGIGRL